MHTKSTPHPPRSPWWRHHRGQLAGGLLLLLVLGLGQGRTLTDYALHLERRWAQATTKALPSAPPRPTAQAVAPAPERRTRRRKKCRFPCGCSCPAARMTGASHIRPIARHHPRWGEYRKRSSLRLPGEKKGFPPGANTGAVLQTQPGAEPRAKEHVSAALARR